MSSHLLLVHFFFHILILGAPSPAIAGGGEWQLLRDNVGIVAMHMQLLHNDRFVIFDRTDFGLSNLTLPNDRCRNDSKEKVVKTDCTAHSIEYDVASNTFCALFVQTDIWCSSGSAVSDGSLIQTGGYNDGEVTAGIFRPCVICDWQEVPSALTVKRWYSTNHILPNGQQITIGGRRQFNYEFFPKMVGARNTYSLPFLVKTHDRRAENNLYPFVFLNVEGNLFIFANNKSILFDYTKNRVVKTYPDIPGGDPRCYPSTGSAVLLPLKNLEASSVEAEVLVCGGAPRGSFEQAKRGIFLAALNTCGRIKITDPNPQWVMETMRQGRVISDMVMLPNGNVLIINGAAMGTAGWEYGRSPLLNPFIYKTGGTVGSRFEVQNPSDIPRMYHSAAVLLRDGRILVGGSNPHTYYNFTDVLFPTELRLEAFSPSYLKPEFPDVRPRILAPPFPSKLRYAESFKVKFQVSGIIIRDLVSVTMLAPPFNTHSFSMNQRLFVLSIDSNQLRNLGNSSYEIEAMTPRSAILAPPGFYLLFVVHQEIPSVGIWVQIQ